jgi:hypothetical protein
MRSRSGRLVMALLLLVLARSARAELEHGTHQWPGRFMAGGAPLGVQIFLDSPAFATYKFVLNFSGKLADFSKLTLWLGGELNLGGRENLAQIEPGVFATLTLEKLLKFPLVPMVTAGLTFPVNVAYVGSNNAASGGFGVKLGGGVYYFLIKNLGLGGEMHFAFAGAFAGDRTGHTISQWAGFWDLAAGVKAAF